MGTLVTFSLLRTPKPELLISSANVAHLGSFIEEFPKVSCVLRSPTTIESGLGKNLERNGV